MAQNRFKAYIQRPQWGDALRAFTADAIQDRDLPDAASWEELEAYLKQKSAGDQAIEDAKYVWQLYEADVLRKMD